jgi:hypothetical protein
MANGQLGQLLDQSFQQEAALVREAQQEQNPVRLQEIQSQLMQLQEQRSLAQAQSQQAQQMRGQIAGLRGAVPASAQGLGGYDPEVARLQAAAPRGVGGQSAGASRHVPLRDPIQEAAIINAQFSGKKGVGGIDITSPEHVAIARAKVEEALKSGEGIDGNELRESILSEIQAGSLKKLRAAKDVASLQADISESRKKIKENSKDKPGMTKKTQAQLETDIAEGYQLDQQLRVIGKRFSEDHFSRWRKANVRILKEAEKAGKTLTPAQKAIVTQYTGFEGAVRRAFDRYRKLITGAAAPVQELAILEKGFLSMNFSATQFQAALQGIKALNMLGLYNKETLLSTDFDIDKLVAASENDPRIEKLLNEWNTAANLAVGTGGSSPMGLRQAQELASSEKYANDPEVQEALRNSMNKGQ